MDRGPWTVDCGPWTVPSSLPRRYKLIARSLGCMMSTGLGRGLPARIGVGAAIAVFATTVAWAVARTAFATTIELKTYDWRMRETARPVSSSDDIVLVWIDDDSLRRMEPLVGRWPWPRLAHGMLIDFLARGPATAVAYDVLFSEADARGFTLGGTVNADGTHTGGEVWSGRESDDAFAESVAKAGNVVLSADARANELMNQAHAVAPSLDGIASLNQPFAPGDCIESRPTLTPPIPSLAASARGIGHTFAVLDDDGVMRRVVPFIRVGDRHVPSLSVATALLARGLDARAVGREADGLRVGRTVLPLVEQDVPDYYGGRDRACRALLPLRGPILFNGVPTFRDFSFYDLFYAEYQILRGEHPSVDPVLFKDRVVVVGVLASALYDVFAAPVAGQFPGALVHGNAIDALLSGRTIRPAPPITGIAGTAIAALLVGTAGAVVSPWVLAAIAAGTAGAILWLSVQWFAGGLWTPLVQPLLAVGLTFVGQLSWQYFVEGREKRQVKRLFSRYVPKNVYEQLMSDPSRAALGGRRRTMTVLFSDVRGFTAMSERATPEEVVGQLNEYFSRMVEVLFDHHGTLDKFVGDMVMGLFGAPLDDPDHADHAVQAAIAMAHALDELNQRWSGAGKPALDIGIGISTGEMVAGNIGSDTIMSYTVIGDTVNLGARLESLNKDFGTRIIISDATRAALAGHYETRPLGEVTVKGKSRAVAIFEVKQS